MWLNFTLLWSPEASENEDEQLSTSEQLFISTSEQLSTSKSIRRKRKRHISEAGK